MRHRRPAPAEESAMAELVISVTVSIDPAKREEAAAVAIEMMRATRAEPGCIAYTFSADLEDPARIHVFERWASQEALDVHFQSPHMATFQKKLGALGVRGMEAQKYEIANVGPLR
jgi:quinol monooxygenase YgiN